MAEPAGKHDEVRAGATAHMADSALQESVRRLAHDLNGALNTLSLNIELVDAATAGGEGEAFDAAGRARYLERLRRAVRELQGLVEGRLRPLGSSTEPGGAAGS